MGLTGHEGHRKLYIHIYAFVDRINMDSLDLKTKTVKQLGGIMWGTQTKFGDFGKVVL